MGRVRFKEMGNGQFKLLESSIDDPKLTFGKAYSWAVLYDMATNGWDVQVGSLMLVPKEVAEQGATRMRGGTITTIDPQKTRG